MTAVPSAAERQGGVFTAEQARAEGWTARTVRRRIVARRWVYVVGRGLAQPRPEWTAWQLAMAAQLSIPAAVISHRTAAYLHGFPDHGPGGPGQECDVILTRHRQSLPRINAHYLRLDASEVAVRSRLLTVTTPARTALDCLGSLPLTAALDLWAWLVTRQVLDPADLQAGIAARAEWYGVRQLRQILGLVAGGAVSGAEHRLHELLHAAGITGWVANAPISDARGRTALADILFPALKVVIEVDGWQAHSSRSSFVHDRRRQNAVILSGYRVLRFSWDDLTNRPSQVIAEIQAALRLAGKSVLAI